MTRHEPEFKFDNTYARELEGFYVPWNGDKVPEPRILRLNRNLAEELGLDPDALDTAEGAAILAGAARPEGSVPLAQAYAGHQFGGFSPQLGDGRAILVGEIIDRDGRRRDLHLKGSGRTPFSRGGDGKAVIGPVLREYLIGEAMHAMGIPTTRALAAIGTGEAIIRDGPKPGAVLARVASSHLRVGTFQFFAARGETDKLRQLAEYTIARHYPELTGQPDRYLGLLKAVRDRQAALIAQWMGVGFVHGVMNTDNMTISGETIDYGPCAFIDTYDPGAVFSSIDQFGRYAYGNQPNIAQWNLARFAETLLELINPDDTDEAITQATREIEAFPDIFRREWLAVMRAKLGLTGERVEDVALVNDLFDAMRGQGVDFSNFFRCLAGVLRGGPEAARGLFDDPAAFDLWLPRWLRRGEEEALSPQERAAAMDRVNPLYIPRNHRVEEALSSALTGDLAPFNKLVGILAAPFTVQDGQEEYAQPAAESFGPYRTFCGT